MDDPRDFLPARYKNSIKYNAVKTRDSNDFLSGFEVNEKTGQGFTFGKKRKSNFKTTNLLIVLFLIISAVISSFFIRQNQDNRQQASTTDPYSDAIISPSISPPETEKACENKGRWFNDTCYLYWEPLPGGTHVVAPPKTIGNHSYATFVPIATANQYLAANSTVVDQEVIPTVTPTLISSLVTNVPNRPETESACGGSGKWFNDVCYVYWEPLPGGTHVVVPPKTINDYTWPTFVPIKEAEEYLANISTSTTNSTGGSATEVLDSLTKTKIAIDNTYLTSTVNDHKYTYFNQLDPKWKNIYIQDGNTFGNVGCGPTAVSIVTGLSPNETLELYYTIGDPNGITGIGTGVKANALALQNSGYVTKAKFNADDVGVAENTIKTANTTGDYSELIEEIDSILSAGWSIIIRGNFGGVGGHWAVVVDTEETDGKIKVIDPNGGKLKEFTLTQSSHNGSLPVGKVTPLDLILAKKS